MADTPTLPAVDDNVLMMLGFVAPTLYNDGPVPPLTDADIAQAGYLATPYRPTCLAPQLQDEAQALYMAHLLQMRLNVINNQGSGGASAGSLSMEKEGDLQRQYTLSASAQDGSGGTGWYDRWNSLWMRCARAGRGAILTGLVRQTPPNVDWANNPSLWAWGTWPFLP